MGPHVDERGDGIEDDGGRGGVKASYGAGSDEIEALREKKE